LEYWQVLPFRDLQTNIETVKDIGCAHSVMSNDNL
jgi:hypothetical protein